MTGISEPIEVADMKANTKIIKDYLQGAWGDILSDDALMQSGVIFWYEAMREGMNPPHTIEIAFRKLMAQADCGLEAMAHDLDKGEVQK